MNYTALACRLCVSCLMFGGLLQFASVSRAATSSEPPTRTPSQKASPGDAKRHQLEWLQKTHEQAYEKIGRRHPAWDGPALEALSAYTRLLANDDDRQKQALGQTVADKSEAAIKAGCDDPLVVYCHLRYPVGNRAGNASEAADALRACAEALDKSQYHSLRKYYGFLRAAEKFQLAAGKSASPEALALRRSAMVHLEAALADTTMPVSELFDVCHDLFIVVENHPSEGEEYFQKVERLLNKHWPNEAMRWLIEGEYHLRVGWHARGGDFASEVSKDKWQLFGKHLAIAEDQLERAWNMDPTDARIPHRMMLVEMGQGKGKERMELWFARAMALNPNFYDACVAKRNYLAPRWYGSDEEQLKFGRECVASKTWGGEVPLILVTIRQGMWIHLKGQEADDYWKLPEVWSDLQSAYEKYYQLNPGTTAHRKEYARHAYRCEQWEVFLRQVALLSPADYSYLGGTAAVKKMEKTARQKVAEAKRNRKK